MRPALVLSVLLCWLLPPGVARADDGPWSWPVDGEVTRAFAPPQVRYGAGHRGVDLASSPGAAVLAAGAGRVTYAGLLAGRGVVVVTHGALRTTYEPVTAAVAVGDAVQAGAALGRLEPGHAGCPVRACLHWGLRRGEEYLDPVRLVRPGPVRLLPLDDVGIAPPASSRPPNVNDGGSAETPAAEDAGSAAGVPTAEDAGSAAGVPTRMPPLRQAAAPEPAGAEPAWSLRASEAPLGAAAVAALVAGIGLLVRPRPRPPDPVSGGGSAVRPMAAEEELPGTTGALLDLDSARLRRRPG